MKRDENITTNAGREMKRDKGPGRWTRSSIPMQTHLDDIEHYSKLFVTSKRPLFAIGLPVFSLKLVQQSCSKYMRAEGKPPRKPHTSLKERFLQPAPKAIYPDKVFPMPSSLFASTFPNKPPPPSSMHLRGFLTSPCISRHPVYS